MIRVKISKIETSSRVNSRKFLVVVDDSFERFSAVEKSIELISIKIKDCSKTIVIC